MQSSPPAIQPTPVLAVDGVVDIDLTCEQPKAQASVNAQSKASSPAPTPKAARPTPPPKGTGSGLLSSNSLFGGPSKGDDTERKGVNIDIHIPLNPRGGNTVNIAQEIVKKYGRDAINPRAAAHRARLLEVAAVANRIGGGDADDMSLDDLSDMDDSNVEMGGMDEDKSATGAEVTAGENGKPVRRRKRKAEEYNKDDDFIDDTELAWQEQAAVAKDGFFVYSGPLVPVGTEAQIESSSSAPARGGRGRGRGRGSRGGATTTTHAAVAAAAQAKDPNAPPPTAGRGRGRGRGAPGVPRKPRSTKADKEKAAAIAAAAAAAGNGTAPNPTTVPSTATASPTPKILHSAAGATTMASASTNMSAPVPPPYAQVMGTTA